MFPFLSCALLGRAPPGALLISGALLFATGCKQEVVQKGSAAAENEVAPPRPKTPDRLPPGELLESGEKAFSLALPRGLNITTKYLKSLNAVGPVDAVKLTAFVTKRVLVQHVETAGKLYIFPRAKVRGGDERIFRIEIHDLGSRTKLHMVDITPPPFQEGLSEEDRWKQVGLRPDGQVIDPTTLE